MRCYKIGERIVLELDKALLPGERIEIVLRVEDPTALPPMEQEPEVARAPPGYRTPPIEYRRRTDPRAGYGQFDPNTPYTGMEQEPDTVSTKYRIRRLK
jgi:hypothetical protein